tara:strand:+ start:333 stop:821 length:489 start_codon:yes stop_codon:yes gene_type:complete
MFAIYKKHRNKLYNKLVELSRNKFFYERIKLPDDFESRIILIFFHLAIIFKIGKSENNKKRSQEVFDNIFLNIEYHIRESGYGDVAVNKKMKTLNKIFFDILVNLDKEKKVANIIKKYFFENQEDKNQNIKELASYFSEFENFCFALDIDNMLNGSINFTYR